MSLPELGAAGKRKDGAAPGWTSRRYPVSHTSHFLPSGPTATVTGGDRGTAATLSRPSVSLFTPLHTKFCENATECRKTL